MDELVEYIARRLVDQPDDVSVRETVDEDGVRTVLLSVAENDMGRVIGKGGRIAKAMRTVVKAACTRAGERWSVEIVDPAAERAAENA